MTATPQDFKIVSNVIDILLSRPRLTNPKLSIHDLDGINRALSGGDRAHEQIWRSIHNMLEHHIMREREKIHHELQALQSGARHPHTGDSGSEQMLERLLDRCEHFRHTCRLLECIFPPVNQWIGERFGNCAELRAWSKDSGGKSAPNAMDPSLGSVKLSIEKFALQAYAEAVILPYGASSVIIQIMLRLIHHARLLSTLRSSYGKDFQIDALTRRYKPELENGRLQLVKDMLSILRLVGAYTFTWEGTFLDATARWYEREAMILVLGKYDRYLPRTWLKFTVAPLSVAKYLQYVKERLLEESKWWEDCPLATGRSVSTIIKARMITLFAPELIKKARPSDMAALRAWAKNTRGLKEHLPS